MTGGPFSSRTRTCEHRMTAEEYKKRLAAAMQDFFAAAGRPVGPDERHRKQDEKGGAGGARDR